MAPCGVADDGDLGADEPVTEAQQRALFGISRARVSLGTAADFESRLPCPTCGTTAAILHMRGGQNTVRCVYCNKHLYNAPKDETGQRPRTVQTIRRDIKPSQQARILDRDRGRCVLCGRGDVPLTIGHMLSVEDGFALGATKDELADDLNLAAMCEACNLGLGRASVSPSMYARIMFHLIRAGREDQTISAATLLDDASVDGLSTEPVAKSALADAQQVVSNEPLG